MRRASRLGVAATVATLALGVSAPSALATGWRQYVNQGWAPRLANAYSGYDYVQQAGAEAFGQKWGCADLIDPTTGWIWYPMFCAFADQFAATPFISPHYAQAIAWNDSQSGQYMSAWVYLAYTQV